MITPPIRATFKTHGKPETFLFFRTDEAVIENRGTLARMEFEGVTYRVINVETGKLICQFGAASKFWASPAPEAAPAESNPAAGKELVLARTSAVVPADEADDEDGDQGEGAADLPEGTAEVIVTRPAKVNANLSTDKLVREEDWTTSIEILSVEEIRKLIAQELFVFCACHAEPFEWCPTQIREATPLWIGFEEGHAKVCEAGGFDGRTLRRRAKPSLKGWTSAPAVVVEAGAMQTVRAMELPKRDRMIMVIDGPAKDVPGQVWEDMQAIGTDWYVITLDTGMEWLVEKLADAGAKRAAVAA